MNSTLARDKVTIFDKTLPRVAMNLAQLKRHHARILRSFAEYPNFNSERLTSTIKAKEGSRTYEFNSLTSFIEYLRDPENETPDALELKYQYGNAHIEGSTIDVVTLTASVMFGETGRNECYITSTDEDWASRMHQFIRSDLCRYKIFRWANFIKNFSFVLAIVCLIIFGSKLFVFASPESIATMFTFFGAALIVAWPMNYFPFKQLSSNRIFPLLRASLGHK